MTELNGEKMQEEEASDSIQKIENLYPERKLPPEAIVTRVAPSPTGFAHLGFVYISLICQEISRNTNGVFIFRLEDTDQKREIKDSDTALLKALNVLDIKYDEGITLDGEEKGQYGPYRQTERVPIYNAYIRDLIEKGMAYYCFMTEEEIEEIRKEQKKNNIKPGIYGQYSKWRDATPEDIRKQLELGTPYVVRFKWPEKHEILNHKDLSGKEYFFDTEQYKEDFVLQKSNGIPTYHLAHLIDDHLMKVNLVVRGNEWISSLPKHIMLHKALGLKPPSYYHVPPIEILDPETKGRRKLSKRKDPEANIFNLLKDGFPKDGIKTYLLWISTSEYDRQTQIQNKPIIPDFKLDPSMLKSGAGSLLDINRLKNISREIIAQMSPEELSTNLLEWSKLYDLDFYNVISNSDKSYLQRCLETVNNPNRNRKDISKYTEIPEKIGFFYNEIYETLEYEISSIQNLPFETIEKIINDFLNRYKEDNTLEDFVNIMKSIGATNGLALNKEELEKTNALGLWSMVPAIIRIAITKRNISPDLYECIRILGTRELENRMNQLLNYLREKNG